MVKFKNVSGRPISTKKANGEKFRILVDECFELPKKDISKEINALVVNKALLIVSEDSGDTAKSGAKTSTKTKEG